jgi:alcohol dehydrogenase (cytochrome c)
VRDGVLYAYSHGDVVEALDAASGELLWRHERRLTPGATFQGKKGVAIAGDAILVPTSDLHVLALNARTGAVIWDHAIDTGGQTDFQIKSSPLVAAGKVIIGVNGFTTRGGNFIVALDLATGREAWRFHTVARPGQPGGESWNGQPVAARTGGSVWVAGSYDPELNLVYFGAAPTYNPGPLRVAKPGFTNEALYTDSTLALNADTGALAWFFQHQANDQVDHDWAFEHTLVDLTVDGARRRTVVTGGKQAIFEANDAATGAYRFSIDMGLQNIIAAIDPKTGAKTLDARAVLKPGQVLPRNTIPGICPDLLGARNLMSTAYDAGRKVLFAPLTDTCIQPWPNGARWQRRPDPTTAGRYGLLKAIDLQSRKVLWSVRERAAPVSGALATAGGLVFLGDADRAFRAYDARSGKVLWSTRLDNAPASYPVTYSVGGRQYVAVATNGGFVHVQAMQQAGRITPPPNEGATLWVFALPE